MSFFKTRITELLGIEYPIIQGGMAAGYVSTAELAAAVGNAGGIGFMCAIQWRHGDLSVLEDEIKKVKDMTDKPFGINVTLFAELEPSWFHQVFEIIGKHEVPAIETSARNPEPYLDHIKQTGAKWIHKAARVRDGVKAAKLGADGITIIGSEEGGHPGAERNATSVVGPLMVDSVDVPVCIGGGFCDGRGLAAVLAMGGEALYMGTRFCASKECIIHPKAKEAIVNMNYNETDYILMSIGDPVRCVRNKLSQDVLEAEKNNDSKSLMRLLGPMLIMDQEGRMPVNSGNMEEGIAPFGMVGGRIKEIKSCREIIDDIVAEAEVVVKKLAEGKYWKA